MQSTQQHDADGQVRPTAALARALVVVVVGGWGGLLAHRLDAVAIIAPFVIWLAWAGLARRDLEDVPGQADRAPVHLSPSDTEMVEGEYATFRVQSPLDAVITTVLAPPPHAALRPRHGALVGAPADTAIEFEPQRWGYFGLGPAYVVAGDHSGAWRRELHTGTSRVRVRPPASMLAGGSGAARPIGIAGLHRSTRRGEGTDIAGVREFVPGDRLRRINWKISSRVQHLHVTEMFMERDTDVLIVTDTRLDLFAPTADEGRWGRPGHTTAAASDDHASSSLDATVHACAAIVQHYVGFGDRVGVHDLGTRIGNLLPGTGNRQAHLLLDQLARARRDIPTENIVRPVPRLASGTLVFVCSPLLDEAVVQEVVRLRQLGAELVVVDTLPESLGQAPVPGRDPAFLTEGWMLRRMEREETVAQLRAVGVPVSRWDGPTSLAGVLLAMEHSRSAPRLRGVM